MATSRTAPSIIAPTHPAFREAVVSNSPHSAECIEPFALKLYVFWKNPLNYVGLAVTKSLEFVSRIMFKLYGKNVKLLSKKIMAVSDRLD